MKGRDWSQLRPVKEQEQIAAIDHRNGIERMVISVNFEAEDADQALWIFPVPGDASQTKVDVVDAFPRFRGRDPREETLQQFGGCMTIVRATQIYPAFVEMMLVTGLSSRLGGVTVQSEVEKWGVHAEVITAESLDALENHLATKKAVVARENLRTIEPYLSKSYSLVVVWIASIEQLNKEFPELAQTARYAFRRQPCLAVEFPTEKGFYPMRPTSVYGTNVVPVRLYVVGYVDADTAASYRQSMTVGFYRMKSLPNQPTNQFTANLLTGEVPYTLVKIRDQANSFTDDLWFAPTSSLRIRAADDLSRRLHGWTTLAVALCFAALVSYVTGGLIRLLLYREWEPYATFGLWNLLTLYALAVQARHSNHVQARFVILFSITFIGLTVAVQMLARWLLAG
ncbi:MAG TPA: DUF2330 domain-containing protein [Verrucomicrobiae bacterium]|nr:DUF2330 domain-containing protein [Verrucomicrobiae bacterium]